MTFFKRIFFRTFAGNLPSVGGGGDDEGDKEKDLEEEKLRQEAIKEAEERRRVKHKKMEEDRENMRQGIREKVGFLLLFKHYDFPIFLYICICQYKIEKRQDSEEEEDDDDDDDFGMSKKKDEEELDPMQQKMNEAKAMAEQGMNMAKDKCKVS